jgi:CRP-like cAMP-binding protein
VSTVENPLFKLVNYSPGSYIILEGEKKSPCFFIIKEGKVNLKRDFVPRGEKNTEVLGPGDFFGVISAMSQYPQVESAIAASNAVLISVAYNRFGELIQKNAILAMKIIRYFSKRLRDFDLSGHPRTGFTSSASTESLNLLFSMAENYFQSGNPESAVYLYQSYIKYVPDGSHKRDAVERLKMLGAPLQPISDLNTQRRYIQNQMIFSENEPGNDMFIIQKGKVKISKIIDSKEVTLNILKAGDLFGEMALLDNKPRSASAISMEDSELLVINKKNFEGMVVSQPQLMTRIITLLSERIWNAYKKLANSMIDDVNGRIADMLLTLTEKNKVKIAPRQSYNFQLEVLDFLKMMGLSDRDTIVFQKFMSTNKFIRVEKESIVCTDLALLDRLVHFYRENRKG